MVSCDTCEVMCRQLNVLAVCVTYRSRAALTYAEAQSRIDDARLQDELSVNLRKLNAIARILRRQRAERGALQLASPEVKFEIDTETHDPLDVGMYQVCGSLSPSLHTLPPLHANSLSKEQGIF